MKPIDLLIVCERSSMAREWVEQNRRNCSHIQIMNMTGTFNNTKTWKIVSKQHYQWMESLKGIQFKDFLLLWQTNLTFEEDAFIRSRLHGGD